MHLSGYEFECVYVCLCVGRAAQELSKKKTHSHKPTQCSTLWLPCRCFVCCPVAIATAKRREIARTWSASGRASREAQAGAKHEHYINTFLALWWWWW